MARDVLRTLVFRALVSTYMCDYFWNVCWDQVVHIDAKVKESMIIAAKDIDNNGYFLFPIKAGVFKKMLPHPWDLYRVKFKAGFNDGILRKCEAQVLWKQRRPSKDQIVFHKMCDPPIKALDLNETRYTKRSEIDINLLKELLEEKHCHTRDKVFKN